MSVGNLKQHEKNLLLRDTKEQGFGRAKQGQMAMATCSHPAKAGRAE